MVYTRVLQYSLHHQVSCPTKYSTLRTNSAYILRRTSLATRSWSMVSGTRSDGDYYALLGVSRHADASEIRQKFRLLSREFHPDRRRRRQHAAKLNDGGIESDDFDELQALANAEYPALDRAYKVLSDPVKRKVYDLYGERGVSAVEEDEELHQALIKPSRTSRELDERVELALRERNQQHLESRFDNYSEMSMHVDASDFVSQPMRGFQSLFTRGARYIERSEMTLSQRTRFPLSRQTSVTIGGFLYDKHGMGTGGLTTRLDYVSHDPATPSVTLASELGWAPKVQMQVSQPVAPHTVVSFMPIVDEHGLIMGCSVNHALATTLQGSMAYNTREGMSASVTQSSEEGHEATAAVNVGPAGPSMNLRLRRVIQSVSVVKVSLQASLAQGLAVILGGSKRVSKRTRLAMGIILNFRNGVTLRLGFTRGAMRFVIPIFLSPFSPQSAFATFCAATAPAIISGVVGQVIKPARERQRRRRLESKAKETVAYVATARTSALAQQRLMTQRADEIVREEKEKEEGLVILVARFGQNLETVQDRLAVANSTDEEDDEHLSDDALVDEATHQAAGLDQKWIDVTIPLQFFVKEGQLSLRGGTKAALLGFYNPCVAADLSTLELVESDPTALPRPQLYVRYTYGGKVFEVTYEDEQAVELPSRQARVMGNVGRVY